MSGVNPRTFAAVGALVALLLVGGCVGPFDGGSATSTPEGESLSPPPAAHEGYDQTTVTVLDGDTGDELGTVGVAVADNQSLRYTGLSDTESLPEDRGMLFTYDAERDLTYVMRGMDFAIDIVYVGANGAITRIHHAPEPGPDEDGNDQRYPGTGRYVLEVTRGWTTDRGVETGDRVEFELPE